MYGVAINEITTATEHCKEMMETVFLAPQFYPTDLEPTMVVALRFYEIIWTHVLLESLFCFILFYSNC